MESRENFKIELEINGKKIGLKPYVRSVFLNVILGMISSLKNVEEPEEVVLKLRK